MSNAIMKPPLFFCFLCIALSQAKAEPLFTADANGVRQSGPTSVQTSFNSGLLERAPLIYSSQATANAGPNGLGGSARNTQDYSLPPGTAGFVPGTPTASKGQASARFDDFVISGPSGLIPVSLNLSLSGSLLAVVQLTPLGYLLGSADSSVSVTVSGAVQDAATGNPFFEFSGSETLDSAGNFTQTGILSGFPNGGSGNITTPEGMVTVGRGPIAVQLALVATSFAELGGQANLCGPDGCDVAQSGHVDGAIDFSDTLTFALSGPVFNVPSGYTVNSAEANIVDNQFVPAPIPEPSTVALLVIGLVGLGFLGYRKTAQIPHLRSASQSPAQRAISFRPRSMPHPVECPSRGYPGSWLGLLARGREASQFFE